MQFTNATTAEDVLAALPSTDEDDKWELKSAALLSDKERGKINGELGKQVSAFGNSGGGYLVFGISTSRQLEPCDETVGRQSMADWLANKVNESVEQPIKTFRIHRAAFTGDQTKAIFVIQLEDSPAAPHQSKDDKHYYYRIHGHSKPAPHFHLELLRNRFTKSVLHIVNVEYTFQTGGERNGFPTMNVMLQAEVTNVSMQTATSWGVYVKFARDGYDLWVAVNGNYTPLSAGVTYRPPDRLETILPGETVTISCHVQAQHPTLNNHSHILKAWEYFAIHLTPVSQNAMGERYFFGWRDHAEWYQHKRRLEGFLDRGR